MSRAVHVAWCRTVLLLGGARAGGFVCKAGSRQARGDIGQLCCSGGVCDGGTCRGGKCR